MPDFGLVDLLLFLPVIGALLLVPMRSESGVRALTLAVTILQFAIAVADVDGDDLRGT